ncbi:DUF3558 domain-containing protein [Gordonia sp. SID5947]|uniref:DUF3558 family protein n=1 Tax=Gordonia sp. SID5947 TaxID=2690315 RepID=UPI00136BB079|nr:DUF3558 family protein [Gordonia sp. SID5947]MYR07550.1 DUF3558 domain-containing protein [Gordonia sp. SID5947]
MRSRRRTVARAGACAAAAAVIGTAALIGCSTSSTDDANPTSTPPITGPEGTATVPASQNPIQQAELWNPCSLPKEVRESINLVDRTRNDDSIPPWRTCSYGTGTGPGPGDPSYGVNVQVSTYSFAQMKENNKYRNVRPATVGDGHPAFLADDKGGSVGANDKSGVDVVWGTSYGSVAINLFPTGYFPIDSDSLLRTFSSAAYPHVPK